MGIGVPIISQLVGGVKDIVSEVVVDKDKARELNVRLQELADSADQRLHEQMLGQIEVNKVEAQHDSLMVAGWRPFIGWGCGGAFIYNTIIAPAFELGQADISFLTTVLLGILGLGTMRTYEKYKGVNTPGPFPIKSIKDNVKKVYAKLPGRNTLERVLPEDAPWMK